MERFGIIVCRCSLVFSSRSISGVLLVVCRYCSLKIVGVATHLAIIYLISEMSPRKAISIIPFLGLLPVCRMAIIVLSSGYFVRRCPPSFAEISGFSCQFRVLPQLDSVGELKVINRFLLLSVCKRLCAL